LARIFAKFERGAGAQPYGGLGIGLYIAHEIVEAHGGTIRAQNAPGRGTRFIVELPTVGPARGKAAPPG
jgi:signal transduction histidine kinase